jgi:hypothetical protein
VRVSAKVARKVGLIVGREWSFPPRFIEEVNHRDRGVTAEFAQLGGESMDGASAYTVLIDRISHEVPFYRSYLKHAALQGVVVVNNPFMWSADDKFFGATLANRLGVASPRTILLPNKEYVPGIVHSESLRNLKFPLDWDAIVKQIGMPCILKDAHGGGWKDVFVCRTREELLHHYDQSGLHTMIVQQFIEWDQFVRCICIGQEHVLPIHYDPKARAYIVDDNYLSEALRERIVRDSVTLVRALGYDMNSIEYAVKDSVPYAIDFMNPAPDFDVNSLTQTYFEWALQHMADLAIDLATQGSRAKDFHWKVLFAGRGQAKPRGRGARAKQ